MFTSYGAHVLSKFSVVTEECDAPAKQRKAAYRSVFAPAAQRSTLSLNRATRSPSHHMGKFVPHLLL